jgi:hypothetical protein
MASNSFKKLPPEVRRELLRHVKPSSSSSSSSTTRGNTASSASSSSSARYYWLAGCTLFVSGAASLPYWATQKIGNLSTKDEALNPAGVRRGAFQNTGSKDAGPDPNWDWQHGRYVYPKGFAEHLKRQNPNDTDLGPSLEALAQQASSAGDSK